jgi:hypothetical protein
MNSFKRAHLKANELSWDGDPAAVWELEVPLLGDATPTPNALVVRIILQGETDQKVSMQVISRTSRYRVLAEQEVPIEAPGLLDILYGAACLKHTAVLVPK